MREMALFMSIRGLLDGYVQVGLDMLDWTIDVSRCHLEHRSQLLGLENSEI